VPEYPLRGGVAALSIKDRTSVSGRRVRFTPSFDSLVRGLIRRAKAYTNEDKRAKTSISALFKCFFAEQIKKTLSSISSLSPWLSLSLACLFANAFLLVVGHARRHFSI